MLAKPLSKHQRSALAAARSGPLYRTVSGWRRLGGGLIENRTFNVLLSQGLVHIYTTRSGRTAAILTDRGIGRTNALKQGLA